MRNHKYKLATLVLSTGILLSACGDGGGDAEAPEEQTDNTTVEESDSGAMNEGTDESGDNSEGDTSDESAGTSEDSSSGDSTESDSSDESTDSSGEDAGSSDSSSDSSDDSGTTESASGADALDQLGSTPEDAISSAQENFDGELVELELDQDNGDWVYKVHLENDTEEYDVELLAEDLSVISEETETDEDNDTEDQFAYGDAIPHDEAVQTAIDEAGGDLEGWTLDKDDGQLEYEVELENTDSGNDVDVTINAESGEVIEVDE